MYIYSCLNQKEEMFRKNKNGEQKTRNNKYILLKRKHNIANNLNVYKIESQEVQLHGT